MPPNHFFGKKIADDFGIPGVMWLHAGPGLTYSAWISIFKALGIILKMTSVCFLQPIGSAERVVQTLKPEI